MEKLSKKEEKRITGILTYRVRGLSYGSIAKIYKVSSERIRQIIVKSEKYLQFNILNVEIKKTHKFLSRKLK